MQDYVCPELLLLQGVRKRARERERWKQPRAGREIRACTCVERERKGERRERDAYIVKSV